MNGCLRKKRWTTTQGAILQTPGRSVSHRTPTTNRQKILEPFSGNERNKLFLNDRAKRFIDLSAISALDNPADGRVFVKWDFDRDGWQDIAVVNTNTPLLNLYRNEIGVRAGARGPHTGRMIALRFVGGNHSNRQNKSLSCRDGYGAKVEVTAGDFKLIREHRCGEGMAAQNSATMIIGVGPNQFAKSVLIRWPSGVTQRFSDVPTGTLLTVYENPAQSPNKTAAVSSRYSVPSKRRWDAVPLAKPVMFTLEGMQSDVNVGVKKGDVIVYTTVATWCVACKRHLPQLKQLRSKLRSQLVHFYGVPVDEQDNRDKLAEYVERFRPAYRLLSDLPPSRRREIKQLLAELLKTDALPSTIVTDASGTVLMTTIGLPTVSQLRKLLAKQATDQEGAIGG